MDGGALNKDRARTRIDSLKSNRVVHPYRGEPHGKMGNLDT